MKQQIRIMFLLGIIFCVIGLDQLIKYAIVSGFRWESEMLSIVLVFNDGVAFSMLAFLQGWLKWLQIGLIILIVMVFFWQRDMFKQYWVGFGFVLGGGISNVIDRFRYDGVVDYVYWHYWFEFAIFNFADVCIDVGVGILLVQWFFFERKNAKSSK